MGRLVDLDSVLEIVTSKRARDKILKLKIHPAIGYEGEYDTHSLACVLLCAFRYSIDRHFTQCMIRADLDQIILRNIDLLPDDFIRQMITGVHDQFRLWTLRKEEKVKAYCDEDPHYLEPFLEGLQKEWIKRKGSRIPESEVV